MGQTLLDDKAKKTLAELEKIYSLPAMSGVMLEVSKLLDDPSTTTSDLSEMIGKDQGMSSKVLTIANSPLYGLPRKVSTIDFAIMIIGFQDVKNIVVALSMIEAFKDEDSGSMSQKDFWLHSLLSGNAAKRISEDLGYKFGAEAFVAGLLHDLGIPVIQKYFPKGFKEIEKLVKDREISFTEAQLEVLGLTHEKIGFILAENWNLPVQLCEVIKNHHNPQEALDNEIITSIVHLVDYMTQRFQIGNFYWDDEMGIEDKVLDILNFKDEEEFIQFIDGYQDLFRQEIEVLRI